MVCFGGDLGCEMWHSSPLLWYTELIVIFIHYIRNNKLALLRNMVWFNWKCCLCIHFKDNMCLVPNITNIHLFLFLASVALALPQHARILWHTPLCLGQSLTKQDVITFSTVERTGGLWAWQHTVWGFFCAK